MQPILEVAIGLVLAVAALAVVVSSAMELTSAFLRLRARSLEQGFARLLDGERLTLKSAKERWKDPSLRSPATAAVLGHPLIRALSSPNGDEDKTPSYIDAVTFGTALMGSSLGVNELVGAAVGSDEQEFEQRVAALPDGAAAPRLSSGAIDWPAYLAKLMATPEVWTTLAALVGDEAAVRGRITTLSRQGDVRAAPLANAVAANITANQLNIPKFLRALVEPLSAIRNSAAGVEVALQRITSVNAHLGRSLESLWQRADRKFDDFREHIEDWYDREMARVSGWYSRRAQWILLAFGIALAFVLNLSMVTVAKRLWEDPTLRAAAVELAEQAVATTTTEAPASTAETSSTETSSTDTADTATRDASALVGTTPPATGGGGSQTPSTAEPGPATPVGVQELVSQGLPIGWNASAWPGWDGDLVLHLLGVVMAGIAASFGAPFWFDLLNRLVNLRAGGKPPPPAARDRTTAPPP